MLPKEIMNLLKYRKRIVWAVIVILLIFTNPSRSAFGSYLHYTEYDGIGRDFNGLIFSVYSDKDYNFRSKETTRTYYIGILGNFFKSPF